MEKIVIYRAFDGTEWADEDDCYYHELEVNAKPYLSNFSLYDYERTPIPFNAHTSIDNVDYLVIRSEEAGRFISEWIDSCGCRSNPVYEAELSGIPICGLWKWNGYFDKWERWETEMAKMRELGEYFQRFEE